ncbi:hypothetical protein JCM10213_002918 [Rhodosporidiobolus nylandii]
MPPIPPDLQHHAAALGMTIQVWSQEEVEAMEARGIDPQQHAREQGGEARRVKAHVEAVPKEFLLRRLRAKTPIPMSPPGRLVREANQAHQEGLEEAKKGKLILRPYIGLPKEFAKKSLEECEPILFKEMLATQQHAGRYLLCRIVSLPHLHTDGSVQFVAEDITGRPERIAIHHVLLNGIVSGPDLAQLFPLGDILAIREPTVEAVVEMMGTWFGVRVASPADYHVVYPGDRLLENVAWLTSSPAKPRTVDFDYRMSGEAAFTQQKYPLAVKLFSDGIAYTSSDIQSLLLHLGRARAHLSLSNHVSAFRDATAASRLLHEGVPSPPHTVERVMLAAAQAHEGLGNPLKAHEEYRKLVQLAPENSDGKAGKKRVKRLLHEEKTGDVKVGELEKQCRSFFFDEGFEVGSFVGPVKAVSSGTRDGGNSLVTTEAVKAGSLLLVEKALVVGHTRNLGRSQVLQAIDVTTKASFSDGAMLDLATKAIAKVVDDPSTLPQFTMLSGGGGYKADAALPLSSLRTRKVPLDKPAQPVNVDVGRLEAILSISHFTVSGVSRGLPTKDEIDNISCAHFSLANLVGHSCAPNAIRRTYRDVILIRARRDIAPGEEVSVAFQPYDADLDKRKRIFTNFLASPGGCPCSLCADDRADGEARLAKRKQLLGAGFSLLKDRLAKSENDPGRQQIMREAKYLCKQLDKTYGPHRETLRPEMYEPLKTVALSLDPFLREQIPEIKEYTLKALEAAGAKFERVGNELRVLAAPIEVSKEPPASPLLQLAHMMCPWASPHRSEDEAVVCLKAARDLSRMKEGYDWETFLRMYDLDIKQTQFDKLIGRARP